MQDFEKLGLFYLGKSTDELLLYESKNLTTHAVCVGMTGSGKTGLGIALLEEAGIDKIPAIIIDPKGDLTNLLLTFPHLSPEEFLPWVDEAEAEKKGVPLTDYAHSVADTWKKGLNEWGEGAERIQKLRNTVEMAIYTPASNAGIPLSILSSFAAPSKELLLDTDAMRDRVISTTSSVLGLLGIAADPIKSREHILISTIIDHAWQKGADLDIASLIQQVQKPSFNKIGALDIDTFFPPKDRLALSISLNNLLASPGFQAWMEGEPLDIKQLLHTKEGKPKLSILSIAHLSESERMFFVTLVLNELLSWMRRQPGTSSLRAILYMDEIFGYFPPTSMPPSKMPMLRLLKQARAFGIGIILATQNPVDLDYKGLSNCGTWFIGKLQTERDRTRVVDGLNAASNGEIDANTLNKMLSLVGNRMFIMRSVHEKNPILFQTRWTMSYLRGPLTLAQINLLKGKSDTQSSSSPPEQKEEVSKLATKPIIPSGISEFFVRKAETKQPVHYRPQIIGIAKLHYIDSKSKIDAWQEVCFIAPVDDDGKEVQWNVSRNLPLDVKNVLDKSPAANSTYDELPSGLMQEKSYPGFEKSFAVWLYQNQELTLYSAPGLGLISKEGETEADFRARMDLNGREKRDELVKKLQAKYADKISSLSDKIKRSQEKMAQKQQEAGIKKTETWISLGTTLLGALLGKGVTKGTISQAGTSLQRAGRITKETQGAAQAEEDCKLYQEQLNGLQEQMRNEIDQLTTQGGEICKVETITVPPRKSDISVEKVALAWMPISA